jgi:hypothetical protein
MVFGFTHPLDTGVSRFSALAYLRAHEPRLREQLPCQALHPQYRISLKSSSSRLGNLDSQLHGAFVELVLLT